MIFDVVAGLLIVGLSFELSRMRKRLDILEEDLQQREVWGWS